MNKRKDFVHILIVLLLCVSFARGEDSCAGALTEDECTSKGSSCRAVMGQQCQSHMLPPSCSLDFSNKNNEECCTSSTNSSHVQYLGCMSVDYICSIQCVQYVKTGTVFIVWEGCGFTDSNFIDVSKSKQCDQCYNTVCPGIISDVSWVKYLVEGSFFLLLLALFIAMTPLFFLAIYLFKWRHYYYQRYILKQNVYSKVPNAEEMVGRQLSLQGLDPTVVHAIETHPSYKKNLIQPKVREDGLIEIPMSDGSTRVLTPDKYHRLYLSLMRKRIALMQAKEKSNSSSDPNASSDQNPLNAKILPPSPHSGASTPREDNAEYSTSSDGTSDEDDDLSSTSEKHPLV